MKTTQTANDNKTATMSREEKLAKIAALVRGMTHDQQEKLIALLKTMQW